MQNCSGAFVCGVDQTQQLSYLKYQGDCLTEFPTVRAAAELELIKSISLPPIWLAWGLEE